MSEDVQNYLNEIRRDFSGKPLDEQSVKKNPIEQFDVWFEEAVDAQLLDPYAMSITTVSEDGQPSTRIVYMRGINEDGFVFYTNYSSNKGQNLENNSKIALNFFWGALERQIRVEGIAEKVTEAVSDAYFNNRPRESQIGAWASNQSTLIKNREELEERVAFYTDKFKGVDVPRPPHWGGYLVRPFEVEFWQGRPSRLHDRIVYSKNQSVWKLSRLAP
ncbi:MAG: pyridoxamine 5'-phosphate oxidase [Vicingaceae bacterium]|nr:pyridoxamine 5'-phosphate oxidase [Vicingaceae bacterium]